MLDQYFDMCANPSAIAMAFVCLLCLPYYRVLPRQAEHAAKVADVGGGPGYREAGQEGEVSSSEGKPGCLAAPRGCRAQPRSSQSPPSRRFGRPVHAAMGTERAPTQPCDCGEVWGDRRCVRIAPPPRCAAPAAAAGAALPGGP
jgi:hypothetical protein